jgi:hypothetical protein
MVFDPFVELLDDVFLELESGRQLRDRLGIEAAG